ncbi:hypothetical protein HMPREF9630_00677 [Peptoanaerobacter stomatis]|uniref:Nucleotidyl transferase domain-containing protein n=1 Tax=Peptoanaerobacter stomatis TaxID=796937 RepID=V9HJT0_9FIRM|nr:nucleotidyltransferase family protein [Peptoanaerobacter stomatis]EHL15308.1 hypothetical protein HMPREF9630_00677 [Peptoanaerobacter stomatis]
MKAIILAGGKGTRLQEVVSDIPKPMAPINNVPFLEILIRQLKKNGINDIVISVGYKKDKIINFFGNRYNGLDINYCIEDIPLGTGGAIKKAIEENESDMYLVINGDTFFDISLRKLIEEHINRRNDVTIAAKKMYNSDRYGSILFENDKIVSFEEKKYYRESVINAGIYVLNRDIFDNIQDKKFSLEKDFFEKYVCEKNMGIFIFEEYFIDIGIKEDYYKAQRELVNIF